MKSITPTHFTFMFGQRTFEHDASEGEDYTFGDTYSFNGELYVFEAAVQTGSHKVVCWNPLRGREPLTIPTLCVGEGR